MDKNNAEGESGDILDRIESEADMLRISAAAASPPDEVEEEDLREEYEELYSSTQDILCELEDVKNEARKWRKRSWGWRVISFY